MPVISALVAVTVSSCPLKAVASDITKYKHNGNLRVCPARTLFSDYACGCIIGPNRTCLHQQPAQLELNIGLVNVFIKPTQTMEFEERITCNIVHYVKISLCFSHLKYKYENLAQIVRLNKYNY